MKVLKNNYDETATIAATANSMNFIFFIAISSLPIRFFVNIIILGRTNDTDTQHPFTEMLHNLHNGSFVVFRLIHIIVFIILQMQRYDNAGVLR